MLTQYQIECLQINLQNKQSMYDPFEIDDQDVSPTHHPPLKQRQNHFTDKFSKTITKNFMHQSSSKQEEYQDRQKQAANVNGYETIRSKRRNIRTNSKILNPFKNPQNASTVKQMKPFAQLNIISIDNDEDIEQIPSPLKKQPLSPEPLIRKNNQDRPIQLVQMEMPSRNQENILFYDDDEQDIQEVIPSNNKHRQQQEIIHLPIHNQMPSYLQDSELNSQVSVMDRVTVKTHSQYFNIKNKQLLRQQIFDMVKPLHTLKMMIARDNSGFNTFWPQFYLKFQQNDQPVVISAKRTTARPISTFILSTDTKDYQQNTNNYLGKLKSNALGDILYVYGPGYNPSNAKEKKLQQRQMIATIIYQSNFFNTGKPRQFQIFALKQGVKYFDLKGVKPYDDEPGLNELFNHEANRDLMNIYKNRKPVWNEEIGGFMLNFKGRVPCPSIKNFILEDNFGHEAMIFGRKEKNQFVMQIADKISPYLAIATALSAFDTRIMCQ